MDEFQAEVAVCARQKDVKQTGMHGESQVDPCWWNMPCFHGHGDRESEWRPGLGGRWKPDHKRPSLLFTCYIVPALLWLREFRKRAWHTDGTPYVLVPFPLCHLILPWKFTFPLLRTFQFYYHFSCIPHIPSIRNPISYSWFWPLPTSLIQDTIVYGLLPDAWSPNFNSSLQWPIFYKADCAL